LQSCRGYCNLHNELVTSTVCAGHWDKPNSRRCSVCEVFMIYPGRFCPCCHTLLRTKPHTKTAKERLKRIVKK
jgi:hypothetical protein